MDYLVWILLIVTIVTEVALALVFFHYLNSATLVGWNYNKVKSLQHSNNTRWKALALLAVISTCNFFWVGFGKSPLYLDGWEDVTLEPGLQWELKNSEPIMNAERKECLSAALSDLTDGKYRPVELTSAQQKAAAAKEQKRAAEKAAYVKAHAVHYPSWFHFWAAVILVVMTSIYLPIAWREEFVEAIKESLARRNPSDGGGTATADTTPTTTIRRSIWGFVGRVVSIDLIMEIVLNFFTKMGRTLPTLSRTA